MSNYFQQYIAFFMQNFCKLYEPRSDMLDFWKNLLKKLILKKNQKMVKKHAKL